MDEPFGPYRLREQIGRGAMGRVYRAFDTRKNREVALKVIADHVVPSESARRRFLREAEVNGRLNHPNVVPVHDYGQIGEHLFIDMRLVDGAGLDSLLRTWQRLSPPRAVAMISDVAAALDAAHGLGIVHRDVKPANMLAACLLERDSRDFVYLADFGIAQALVGAGSTRITGTGQAVGTLQYMAPERYASAPADRRSDVYALACVLYEMLTGRTPFRGRDLPTLMYQVTQTEPDSCRRHSPQVPVALDEVVRRGLAKDPAQRFASAGEMARAAEDALARRIAPVAAPAPTAPGRTALRYVARSDRGLVSQNNRDSIYLGPRLAAVADGGAHRGGGEIASKLAIAALVPLDDDDPGPDPLGELAEAVAQGNDAIGELAHEEEGLELNTTVTALVFGPESVCLAHRGNSRAYRLADGRLRQLTTDEMAVTDWSSPQQYREGSAGLDGGDSELALTRMTYAPGDRYLVCTDGLHQQVSHDQLAYTLGRPDSLRDIADALIELALRAGGPDNVTVGVVEVIDLDARAP